ncbi:MAG: HAD-IIB family hydrolase [Burkholderiaceae bacterium]
MTQATPATPSRPLPRAPGPEWAAVCGVLTDIDDTLTRHGAIELAARQALQQLARRGIPVVAVTGRPMGWSEPFVRDGTLPVIVAENGAGAWYRDAGALREAYVQDAPTRARNLERLRAVAAQVLREVSGATLARDSAGRATDIAVDHDEFAHLDAAQVARVVAIMRDAGMTATVSSIHVNGWFGEHTKLTGARWIVQRLFGRDLDAERERWVYVGDSTNDQEMFAHFPLSVGVANLMRFAGQLHTWPAYLAAGERGQGFAEVAQVVLAAR